jgi:UDP-glucose 4-epimerase
VKILVTGGAGFIGSHIVDGFCSAGHRVVVVDDLSTGKRSNLHPDAELVVEDIRNGPAIHRLLAEGGFDLLCHQAAQMDVRKSVADPAEDASVNIMGLLRLMEGARAGGVRRILFASSGGAIYGEQDVFPADESHATRPISPYGVAKLASERYLFYYHAVYGMDVTCLRYANVYGPRQNPEGEAGVVAVFTTRMLANGTAVINGDGLQTRDYTYVGDVARANILAAACTGFRMYNVGTGVETDVVTLFRHIHRFTGSTIPERHGEAKLGEQRRSVLDAGLIGRELGWTPSVGLEEGLQRTVEFFRGGR